ncbi:hypothetical protein [Magnetospirillum fulvum]|uniref:Uncharacterized protein n=1 Tax=Magnetospirillum fulvum MGU-K5 TaxID=1316936 RepID=S9TJ90_MAGFU|nr:hypothetical protein [Magnetospirillum fulvum]EPY02311.1 hypothetical protein K678_06557 [Magnetospirillum fulvum MGU-K5]
MNTLPTIRPLDRLARCINEQQAQIEAHARNMLFFAKVAGELLIEARDSKERTEPFKEWVPRYCRKANGQPLSYVQATKYMNVARRWDDLKGFADETCTNSIDAFLGYQKANPAPKSNLPTFTEDDAEYALKIAARLDSDFEGERDVAADKLNTFAKQHGMTGEELVEKAKKLRPAQHLTNVEAGKQELRAEILAPFQSMSKQELLDVIFNLIVKLSREA